VREVREETGLEVRTNGLAWVEERVAPDGRWLAAEFVAEVVGGSEDALQGPSGTVREVRWATPEQVGELLGARQGAFFARLLENPPDSGNYVQVRAE